MEVHASIQSAVRFAWAVNLNLLTLGSQKSSPVEVEKIAQDEFALRQQIAGKLEIVKVGWAQRDLETGNAKK